jgi:hypothetical protein
MARFMTIPPATPAMTVLTCDDFMSYALNNDDADGISLPKTKSFESLGNPLFATRYLLFAIRYGLHSLHTSIKSSVKFQDQAPLGYLALSPGFSFIIPSPCP